MIINSTGLSASEKDIIEREFPVTDKGILILTSDLGSIDIQGSDTDKVSVTIHREIRSNNDEKIDQEKDRLNITFDQSGNDIKLNVDYDRIKNNSIFSPKNLTRLNFKITVPLVFDINTSTAGGYIEVKDIKGQLQCKSSGGHIEVYRISGRTDIRTSGGHINANVIKGSIYAHTSGGHIIVGAVEGDMELKTSGGSIDVVDSYGAVRARTSGGGISIEGVEGHVDARTSGGSIRVVLVGQISEDCFLSTSGGEVVAKVDPALNAEINAITSGGHVSTNLPVRVAGKTRNSRLKGTLNNGGKELTLKTSGGDIRLEAIH